MNDVVLLVSRILLVALFLISGLGFAAGSEGVAGYFAMLGIPAPGLMVWLTVLLKLAAGIAVLVGFQTRYGSYALAAFCIAAPLIAHTNFADQNEMTQFLKDFAIAGGFLALSVAGAGAFSLDARRSSPAYA